MLVEGALTIERYKEIHNRRRRIRNGSATKSHYRIKLNELGDTLTFNSEGHRLTGNEGIEGK